ncbi:MAG: MliC family protein [Hyphomicrobiales bacterium]
MKFCTANLNSIRLSLVFLLIFIQGLAATATATATAASSSLEGRWLQQQLDAGACSDCEVLVEAVFDREGLLLVTSNTGWTAQIFYDRNASHVAAGVGRWDTSEVFDLGMQIVPGGMEMRMRRKDGITAYWTMASFERLPPQQAETNNESAKEFPSVAEETGLDPISKRHNFLCDNGKRLTVIYDYRASETIAVAAYDSGRNTYMIQVVSGSGTRFANETHSLHTKGGSAVFETQGQTYVCTSG